MLYVFIIKDKLPETQEILSLLYLPRSSLAQTTEVSSGSLHFRYVNQPEYAPREAIRVTKESRSHICIPLAI